MSAKPAEVDYHVVVFGYGMIFNFSKIGDAIRKATGNKLDDINALINVYLELKGFVAHYNVEAAVAGDDPLVLITTKQNSTDFYINPDDDSDEPKAIDLNQLAKFSEPQLLRFGEFTALVGEPGKQLTLYKFSYAREKNGVVVHGGRVFLNPALI